MTNSILVATITIRMVQSIKMSYFFNVKLNIKFKTKNTLASKKVQSIAEIENKQIIIFF